MLFELPPVTAGGFSGPIINFDIEWIAEYEKSLFVISVMFGPMATTSSWLPLPRASAPILVMDGSEIVVIL